MDGRRAARLAFLCIPALVLAAWSLAWGAGQALADSADLLRRVEEVALFLHRDDPYADPDLTYPPSALPVFTLILGALPSGSEPAAWLAMNLAAALALVLGLRAIWANSADRASAILLACWVLAARPTRAGLALGQFHLIPVALAVGTIPALAARRDRLAGALLGIALIKPTMAAPLWVVWIVRGHRRAAGVALGVQAALILIASAWLSRPPWTLVAGFLANARGQSAAGSLDLPGLLGRAGVSETPALLAGGGLVVLNALVAWRTRSASESTATALALTTAAVATYHRHYDLVLLLPAVLAIGRRAPALALPIALLLIPPTHPAWIQPLAATLDAAVASSAYLLGIALAFQCLAEHRRGAPEDPRTPRNAIARCPEASGDRAFAVRS
jgi:hypothetical protein